MIDDQESSISGGILSGLIGVAGAEQAVDIWDINHLQAR